MTLPGFPVRCPRDWPLPLRFLALQLILCFDVLALSSSPLVHGLPRPAVVPDRPKVRVGAENVSALFLSVVGVLSSTLLPGFIGPESKVRSVDLTPSTPLPVSVSPFLAWFDGGSRNPALFRLALGPRLAVSGVSAVVPV